MARAPRWYYSPDGKNGHGPVTDAELKELIRTGRLTRSGKVSLDDKTWRPASHLKGVKWPRQQRADGPGGGKERGGPA